MKPLLIHPHGNPFARNAAIALREAFGACQVLTTYAYRPSSIGWNYLRRLPRAMRNTITRELERRAWLSGTDIDVLMYPFAEVCRVLITRSGLASFLNLNVQGLADRVALSLDHLAASKYLTSGAFSLIYGYEDCCAQAFSMGRSRGITCTYELPIMHFLESSRIQKEEAELFPDLKSSLFGAAEPEWKLERKQRELELADRIIVNSTLTRNSVIKAGISPNKISLVPYGVDLAEQPANYKPQKELRVLFVGRVGPRKGVHYLLRAWKELQLPQASLKLIGVNEFPSNWLRGFTNNVTYLRSIPAFELSKHYSQADVLVLPSLVEGFGMVLLEALAHGVPLIASENTAAPDLITPNREGFIIPIRDTNSLKERLIWCYENREQLQGMREAARQCALRHTWLNYREGIKSALKTSGSDARSYA